MRLGIRVFLCSLEEYSRIIIQNLLKFDFVPWRLRVPAIAYGGVVLAEAFLTKINETLQNTSEVIKKLPEFPEIMEKANQALTFLASGQIPQSSNTYSSLNEKKRGLKAIASPISLGLDFAK